MVDAAAMRVRAAEIADDVLFPAGVEVDRADRAWPSAGLVLGRGTRMAASANR